MENERRIRRLRALPLCGPFITSVFILSGVLAACSDNTEDPGPVVDAAMADAAKTDAAVADMGPNDGALGQDGGASERVLATLASEALRLTVTPTQLVVARDDTALLRLPLDAFQLGVVGALNDAVNYDPSYLWTDIPGALPADLVWRTPEGLSVTEEEDTLQLNLDFGSDGLGHVRFQVNGANRVAAHFVPPPDLSIAFMRIRPRADAQEGFYGLGEVFDTPNHRGKVRAMQLVLDEAIESANNEAHVPIPMVLGTRGWGLFVETYYPGVFAVAVSDDETVDASFATAFASQDGLRFHLFVEAHPLDLTQHYYELTGYPKLPAPWALGPWVWRDENEDQAQVERDLETIRELDLATSGYWIDRPYATEVNTFDFKDSQFPDPEAMVAKMHALGFRFALWHAPYVNESSDASAALHAEAVEGGYYPSQHGIIGTSWGRIIDFSNPEAYDWWQALLGRYTALGVEGYKLDYAEDVAIGIFSVRNAFAFADGSTERTMHAIYQTLYHQVYAETLPEDGGFLLCRSATWGGQTNGPIIWPGDLDANLAYHREEWTQRGETFIAVGGLPAAVVAGQSLGPSGFPFFGSDNGGYRHASPDKETFTRWFEHTALSTVMQIGTNRNDVAWEFREENGFDEEMLGWYREYTRLHLRLFPYEWTYAKRIAEDGRPIQRPYGLQYPNSGKHPFDVYTFGDDLLVAPVIRPGVRTKTVPFPPGNWVDWWTGEIIEGGVDREVPAPLETLPLYLRAGGIIPMLRPTIDTLSPTTVPDEVDSFATSPGRLYARIAPGPAHAFTVYDGSRIAHDTTQGTFTLTLNEGDVFNLGMVLEILGQDESPTSVTVDGSVWAPLADPAALTEGGEGVYFDAQKKTLWIAVGPGNHVVEIDSVD